jgi:hypothetical protein
VDYLIAYLMITAGFAFLFVFLYATANDSEFEIKTVTARCAMLSWLWPIGLIVFILYGAFQIIKGTPQFFKDAFGRSNESEHRS